MKKHYSLAFLGATFLLAGCAADAPENANVPENEDGIGYIRIEFANMPATRAFEEGANEANEADIYNADFVFYCADGTTFTRSVKDKTGGLAKWVDTDNTHSGDKCCIVKLPKMPESVACIVNGNRTYSGDLYKDLDPIRTYCRKASDNNWYFYMSSSTYYKGNDHAVTYKTPISPEMLVTTEKEAAAEVTKAVRINVDRYVAKVKINNSEDLTKSIDSNGRLNPEADREFINGEITFEPMFTFLTSEETQAFPIKQLPSWNNENKIFSSWDEINDETHRRSGWVASTDGENVKYATLSSLGSTKTFGTSPKFYTYENRPNNSVQETSVVVAGKYRVTKNGKDMAASDGTFYLVAFNDLFDVYATEKEAVNAMGGNYDEGDRLVPEGVMEKEDTDLPSYDITNNAEAKNKWEAWTGWMMLKGKPEIVTRCVKYTGGYGYYARQIQRNNIDGVKNAIVRNHVYNITLGKIAGMGVGIPDPNQPIIPIPGPDPKEKSYYLHMSVSVNPWISVNQNVDWK